MQTRDHPQVRLSHPESTDRLRVPRRTALKADEGYLMPALLEFSSVHPHSLSSPRDLRIFAS
jgi:hypothetical protein